MPKLKAWARRVFAWPPCLRCAVALFVCSIKVGWKVLQSAKCRYRPRAHGRLLGICPCCLCGLSLVGRTSWMMAHVSSVLAVL